VLWTPERCLIQKLLTSFQGTSFPVWIYYKHYLDDAWCFFSKPWCASRRSGAPENPDRRGRATPFLTIPSSLCSLSNLAVFSTDNSSHRNVRTYVAVTDGTRITIPKGNCVTFNVDIKGSPINDVMQCCTSIHLCHSSFVLRLLHCCHKNIDPSHLKRRLLTLNM